MKITESQLRRIVRQEILRESSPLVLPSGSELEGNSEIAGASDAAVEAKVRKELADLLGRGLSPLEAAEQWMNRWARSVPHPSDLSHDVRLAQRKFVYGIVTDPLFVRQAKRAGLSGQR